MPHDMTEPWSSNAWRAHHAGMVQQWHRICGLLLLSFLVHLTREAQIDPYKRSLLQLGYNQPVEGHWPMAGYLFYLLNQPDFIRPDLTLRLAVAPTYLDSEFGFRHALGPHTDLALGLSGGGFANSYNEIRRGKFRIDESFTGHGGIASVSLYHRFNPNQRLPLNAVVRGILDYSSYSRDDDTADTFVLPDDRFTYSARAGLRLGGREPMLLPALGVELSAWYEGSVRDKHGPYGFDGDRAVEANSHRFWGRALFAYTLPWLEHNFNLSITAGTTRRADRFSAYRLGGTLPLLSEFRLDLPGYEAQEITAREFVLFNGVYWLPIDSAKRWSVTAFGAVAGVNYLSGFEQADRWLSGIGAGVGYKAAQEVWQVVLAYAYGFNALRSDGRGGQSVVLLFQFDFEARRRAEAYPSLDPVLDPERSRGLERIFRY
jgi:hypothetical protein